MARPDAHAVARAVGYAYPNPDGDACAIADAYPYPDAYPDAVADGYAYPDAVADGHRQPRAHANGYARANRNANPHIDNRHAKRALGDGVSPWTERVAERCGYGVRRRSADVQVEKVLLAQSGTRLALH